MTIDEALEGLWDCTLELCKETYEWNGTDMGDDHANIEYRNYLANNPIKLGSSVGPYNGTLGGKWGSMTHEQKIAALQITSDEMKGGSYPGNALKAAGLLQSFQLNSSRGKQTIIMHREVGADLQAICDEIMQLGWFDLRSFSGWRPQNTVSKGCSRHCWGCAIDINAGSNGNPWFNVHIPKDFPEPAEGSRAPWGIKKCPYSGTYSRTHCMWHWGHPVISIFARHGWGWGGSYGDTMHFSVFGGS